MLFTGLASVQMVAYIIIGSRVKPITTFKQPPARHFRENLLNDRTI